jgi:hypothetical protein
MNASWECHRCHKVNAPHANQCDCVAAAPVQPLAPFVPANWPSNGTISQPWDKCAFDGLPQGAYGLVCFCRKCSPYSLKENGFAGLPAKYHPTSGYVQILHNANTSDNMARFNGDGTPLN